MRRAATILCVVVSGCGNCNQNAVVVAEEIAALGEIVDFVEVLQDADGDGGFVPSERAFVVDPRASTDKIVVVRFLLPLPRARFFPATDFVEFASFPAPPVTIEGMFFDLAMTDSSPSGADTDIVVFDISDDLYDASLGFPSPVVVTLHLDQLELDFGEAEGRVVFVLASQAPAPGPPPRVIAFNPDLPDLPGWSRPITAADFLPGDDLFDVLARAEASNFVGATLPDRVYPHHPIHLDFDQGMSNFVVSITPEDPLGLRMRAGSLGFFSTFQGAGSDTSAGMAPDTEYRVIALSKWATVNMPMASGTQDGTGLFLMPFMDDALYASLQADGFSDEDLALEGPTYRFRTGPLRIREPAHKGAVGIQSASGGEVGVVVEYVEPAAAPAIAFLGFTAEFDGNFFGTSVPFSSTGTFDLTQAQPAPRQGQLANGRVELPPSGFDGEVVLSVEATAALPGSEFIGFDEIRFDFDSIVPDIADGLIEVTNVHPDGELDKLCVVADCDVVQFILQVPGGTEVTLDVEDADTTACANDVRQYCFSNVPLGLPAGAVEGELTVTIIAVDDAGNRSDPVQFTTEPECTRFDKYVATGGSLVQSVTLPDGTPAVAWTNGRNLSFAEAAPDGSWSQNRRVVFQRPLDDAGNGSIFRYGLGFDMVVNESTGQPAVCFIVAQMDPATGTESLAAGTFRIMERQVDGSWSQTASLPNVRPLGCSLTNYKGTLAAGWVQVHPTSTDPLNGQAFWGRFFPPLGFFPQIRLTRPSELLTSSTLVWDVDIAGSPEALYFTYRASHPIFAMTGDAPGSVVAGYFDDAHPGGVAQVVCAAGDTCPTPSHPIGDGTDNVMLGAGPRIIATPSTVDLSFVNIIDQGVPFWEINHGLTYVSAPRPSSGDQLAFAFVRRTEQPGPVHGYGDDGLTTQPTSLPADTHIRSVFYSAPAMATSVEDDLLFIAFSRGGLQFGGETISVFSYPVGTTTPTFDVVEARVGSNPVRHAVASVSINGGPKGYRVAFHHPQANRVVFADQHDTLLYETGQANQCPAFWRGLKITEEEMNLNFGHSSLMWSPICFPAVDPTINWPFTYINDTVGDTAQFASFLDDQFVGVLLQDGRGPLKVQQNVCVPSPGEWACDPDIGGSFDPAVVTQAVVAGSSSGTDLGPGVRTFWASVPQADANCAEGGQVVTDLDVGIFCVICPPDSSYDPDTGACRQCAAGEEPDYATEPVHVRPRFLVRGLHSFRCLSCPSQDPARIAIGEMPWILTNDGDFCTRCSDGSRLLPCQADAECGVLGNDNDYRCSSAAAIGWNGRTDAPQQRVCVPRCDSNADCPEGICDTSDGDNDGVPDGICETLSGTEIPAGLPLACRPIGCDECWQNDFCESNDDCPLNHICQIDPGRAPLCLARPLLSPTVEEDVLRPLLPPDIEDEVIDQLHTHRDLLIQTMQTIRIPDTIALGDIPVFSDVATDFSARVTHVGIELERDARSRPGRVILRLDLTDGLATVSGSPFDIGEFTLKFLYEAHIEPRSGTQSQDGPAYAGVGFTLVGVDIDGGIDIPILPLGGLDDLDLDRAQGTLMGSLGPFANLIIVNITTVLGAMDEDAAPGFTRCLFMTPSDDGTLDLPRVCNDGELEEPHLVEVEDDEIVVTVRRCM